MDKPDSTSTPSSGLHTVTQRPYHVEPSIEEFAWRPSTVSSSSTINPGNRAGPSSSPSVTFQGKEPTTTGTSWRRHDPTNYSGYFDSNDYDLGAGSSTAASDITITLHRIVSACILGYSSTAMVMPFEVGKALLQVQYMPKETYEQVQIWKDEDNDYYYYDEHLQYPETEEEVELMFSDAVNMNEEERRRRPPPPPPIQSQQQQYQQVPPNVREFGDNYAKDFYDQEQYRDSQGYLMRRSIYDASTKPEWILPESGISGIWDMIRAIGRFTNEGYISLWKSQLTTFVNDAISTSVQPVVQTVLSSIFLSPELLPSLPIVHSPHPMLPLMVAGASHAITGILVLPLDLVRMRLIAQSAHPRYRTYRGPVHALKTIIDEETQNGSIWQLYTDPLLFFPALIDSTLRPLLHLATPLIIERRFNISRNERPVAYGLAELALGTASILCTLPVETVRRRLQVQRKLRRRRQNSKRINSNNNNDIETNDANMSFANTRLKTCVETRDRPYFGMVHCVYSILTEETSTVTFAQQYTNTNNTNNNNNAGHGRSKSPQEQRQLSRPTKTGGLIQLYRGFSMLFGVNVVVFLLQLATGRDGYETVWAEM